MSKDIKYLPLISKVETIDTLLRTTSHSAFPITQSSSSSITKVPILYREKRLISEGSDDVPLEQFVASMYQRPPASKPTIQSKAGGDGEEGERELVLHGLILRSQLVTLLENNVFIDESEQVQCVNVVDMKI